mmetsp:Transcript_14534/g.17620  ORF Transcript_14534/g.17620 Transcript_14534/m.17620 type:complete len:446 (+) Transcript_14534:355-1692(+)
MGLFSRALVLGVLLAMGGKLFLTSEWSKTMKLRVAIDMFGWDGFLNIVQESVAERLIGKKETESRIAWQELAMTISDIDLQYLGPTRGFTDPSDLAEGHRFLSHVVKQAFDSFLENDPAFPSFVEFVSPIQKVLGDNPDAFYHICNLDSDLVYKVTGRIQDEAYISFTLAEAKCRGCFTNAAIADINNFQLALEPDGKSFELYISKERPEGVDNWIPIELTEPDYEVMLVTRHYYERKECAQNDRNLKQVINIEVVHGRQIDYRPPPRDEKKIAERLRNVKTFLLEHTVRMKSDPSTSPSWFSFTPNVLGKPVQFREDSKNKNSGGGFGAVDIYYSAGLFKLASDEALIMEATLPRDCAFASVNLWNRFLQTLDYENHQVSLNRKQMHIKEGNLVRIWIGPSPPTGRYKDLDWLDTEGRVTGFIFWRFILPDKIPEQPRLTLVKV